MRLVPRLHNVVELRSKTVREYDFLKLDNCVPRRNTGGQTINGIGASFGVISLPRSKIGLRAGIVILIDLAFTKFEFFEIPNCRRFD
jgi:hypothetical protein